MNTNLKFWLPLNTKFNLLIEWFMFSASIKLYSRLFQINFIITCVNTVSDGSNKLHINTPYIGHSLAYSDNIIYINAYY